MSKSMSNCALSQFQFPISNGVLKIEHDQHLIFRSFQCKIQGELDVRRTYALIS